jgi:transcriptional regulator of acetoin/glycerol metabolism
MRKPNEWKEGYRMTGKYVAYTVAKAWDELADTGAIRTEALRPAVAASWRRSQEAGVNPKGVMGKMVLNAEQLETVIKERSDLIEIARPFMSSLYEFVAGSGFMVMISDEHGRIMEVTGDENALRRGALVNVLPGSSWAENDVGTNGIGTALVTEKPVQISGKEHYCETFHTWTCSAAPIRDGSGQIIGALQMSGPSSKTHLHTLGMVVAAVEAIGAQMNIRSKVRELTVLNDHFDKMFQITSDGILLVNTKTLIHRTNSVANRLLGLSPEEPCRTPFSEMISKPHYLEEMLTFGKAFDDIEMTVETSNGQVQCLVSGKVIRDDSNSIRGGVISLNPTKRINKLISRYSGSYATFRFEDIVGRDIKLRRAIELGRIAAESDSNVLIYGESGTGKEMFAQSIHNNSRRANGPFVPINCGAIPRELVGSELFGYEEGAFTGAVRGGRPGKFELASGGTLFLDEIGDMPLEQQIALHRVLEDKMVARIGGTHMTEVDVRIICATNKNLKREVAKGNFRQDLYYRLNVIYIFLPPLRERPKDIPLLFNFFLSNAIAQLEVDICEVDPDIIDCLTAYKWPGNVRELQNVVERMVSIATDGRIGIKHVPDEILYPKQTHGTLTPLSQGLQDPQTTTFRRHRERIQRSVEAGQREELLYLLEKHGGNITQVAKELDVSRNTVYRRMKRLDLSR